MTKGVFGLNLSAVAVLVFALACFTGLEVLVLLAAYALLIEKDRWLVKQVFQAIYLKLAYLVALTVVGWVFGFFEWVFKYAGIIYSIEGFIDFLLLVGLFLMAFLAITKVMHGKDADLPFISGFAEFTVDAAAKATEAKPAAPAAPAAPVPPVAPVVPVVPVTPAAPETPKPFEPVIEDTAAVADQVDPNNWICQDCGRDNSGKFCMGCGKPRPV